MNQEKPLTLLGAMPELGTLEKYLKDCYLKEVDIDTNIVSTFGEKVNDRITELSKTYNLQVNQEECFFIDDLIEFVKREPELIKEPLEESEKTDTLDDAMMDIYTLLNLMRHCSNGSEAIHHNLGGIFLLLARAAKEKAEYFQEKYQWDFSIKVAPEVSEEAQRKAARKLKELGVDLKEFERKAGIKIDLPENEKAAPETEPSPEDGQGQG